MIERGVNETEQLTCWCSSSFYRSLTNCFKADIGEVVKALSHKGMHFLCLYDLSHAELWQVLPDKEQKKDMMKKEQRQTDIQTVGL